MDEGVRSVSGMILRGDKTMYHEKNKTGNVKYNRNIEARFS
jgi:lysylphosphatidylglycerol synthetase-like protein (DUF2156 family)